MVVLIVAALAAVLLGLLILGGLAAILGLVFGDLFKDVWKVNL